MNTANLTEPEKVFYNNQNRKIHQARAQLGMGLDDCRELAREISGKPSVSSLTTRQRWELIEILKAKGARVSNPPLSEAPVPPQGNHRENHQKNRQSDGEPPFTAGGCPVEERERPEDVYPNRLAYWNRRFPKRRPGYASNEQLAWIQALFLLDFDDGRRADPHAALRGFIYRQTMNQRQGPVSDLAFLRGHQVQAVMIPLKGKGAGRPRKREDG